MTKLQIYDGQDKLQETELKGDTVTLGRDPANHVVLADSSVSRRHAQVEPTGNFFLIRDKGSTNGTFVNDMLVHVQLLSHGDVIRVGKYLLRVETRRPTGTGSTRVRVEKRKAPGQPPSTTKIPQTTKTGETTVTADFASIGDSPSTSLDFFLRLKELHTEIGYVHGEQDLLNHCLEIILTEITADRGAFLVSPTRAAREGTPHPSTLHSAATLCRNGDAGSIDEIVIADHFLDAAFKGRSALIYPAADTQHPGTAMVAPLVDRGVIQGVVYVDRVVSTKPFSENDRLFLTAIADQITISLANARLFEEMYAEREKVQAIFTSLTDGVLVADTNFLISDANIAATILLGTNQSNPIGQPLFSLFRSFEISPDLEVLTDEASTQGTVFQLNSKKSAKQVPCRSLDGRIVPYPRGDAVKKGFVVTLRDATQSRRMEQLKSEFIGNVAHKLRTPLTVIEANLPLLRGDVASESVRQEIMDEMERNSRRLCHLVQQFVEFADMELRSAGAADVPALSSMKKLVDEVFQRKESQARQKGIVLEGRIAADLPLLRVRASRLTDALERIIDNSFKFSGQGSRVVVEGEVAGGSLKLHFVDDGPGIPPEEIDSVFYVGRQVDTQQTGQVPGAGLGLTIARHIVQEHGGEVRIASPFGFPDHGTRVSVILPLKLGEADTQAGGGDKAMDYADLEAHSAS